MKDFTKITLGPTNCYLLQVEGGYLMVDCGRSGDEHVLLSKLSRLGITIPSIKYLLLTHHHRNHSGLLKYLLSQNADLRVILSVTCAHYLETGLNQVSEEVHIASATHSSGFSLFHKHKTKLPTTFTPYLTRNNDIIINLDDICLLPIRGKDLLVLPTPGHTDDSISLIYKTNAFVGDAARNMLEFLGESQTQGFQYNRTECYESWKKLIALGIQDIHPSHGSSFPSKQLETLCHDQLIG